MCRADKETSVFQFFYRVAWYVIVHQTICGGDEADFVRVSLLVQTHLNQTLVRCYPQISVTVFPYICHNRTVGKQGIHRLYHLQNIVLYDEQPVLCADPDALCRVGP